MYLLLVLAEPDPTGGGSSAGTLLGIAAIIGALVPVALSLIRLLGRGGPGDDEQLPAPAGVAPEVRAALDRVRFLEDTVADLERERDALRRDRRLMLAEMKLQQREVGHLEAQLAQAKANARSNP